MPTWIVLTQWIARLVLAILVVLSVWSISIIIDRRRYFRSAHHPDHLNDLKKAAMEGALHSSGIGGIPGGALRTALAVPAKHSADAVDRAVQSYLTEQQEKMEKGLTVLATLGANAPFIGLFGTVLGIIQAFGELSSSSAGTQGVMRGISEALVATAVGLFVAIPAVVAYNYFSSRVRTVIAESELLRDLYVSRRAES